MFSCRSVSISHRPVPQENSLTPEKIALSRTGQLSCSSCHVPSRGCAGASAGPVGDGAGGVVRREVRAVHDTAFADTVAPPGFDVKLYDGLRTARTQITDGDHDMFGDGRVRIVATPGHTPGHQVLFVRLADWASGAVR